MVISLLAIGALVAVAADTGFFFDYRRRMQSGADSAAMAGAEQLLRARIVRSTIIWTRSRFDGSPPP